jgi:rSAM/selenodomain-associated transferase 1
METCAILFVKEPVPGKVKTRLQSVCSAEEAARLYQAFIRDSAALLAASSAERKVIAYAPAGAEGALRDLIGAGPFDYVAQPQTDLGGRMDGLLRWSFSQGAQRTVVIGSDTPSLPPDYVDQGLALLTEKRLVLGPSTDGGYYLVGQREANSEIFLGVEWSSGRVLEQSVEKVGMGELGLLPVWYDVDTPPEAGFLKMHLEAMRKAGSTLGRHSLEVLRGLELPPPS